VFTITFFNLLWLIKVSAKGTDELLERYTQYPSIILETRPRDYKTCSWLIAFYHIDFVKFNFIITVWDKIMFVSNGVDEFVMKGKINGK
jgi:hypothetical protein